MVQSVRKFGFTGKHTHLISGNTNEYVNGIVEWSGQSQKVVH